MPKVKAKRLKKKRDLDEEILEGITDTIAFFKSEPSGVVLIPKGSQRLAGGRSEAKTTGKRTP